MARTANSKVIFVPMNLNSLLKTACLVVGLERVLLPVQAQLPVQELARARCSTLPLSLSLLICERLEHSTTNCSCGTG